MTSQTPSPSSSPSTLTPTAAANPTHELIREEGGYAQPVAENQINRFAAGSRVRVTSMEHGFSQVECEGGRACYVATNALRSLSEQPTQQAQQTPQASQHPTSQAGQAQPAPTQHPVGQQPPVVQSDSLRPGSPIK